MDASIIVYLVPALLCMVGFIQYDLGNHNYGKKILWLFLYIYLIVIMGLRFEVGGDTLTYMEWFKGAHDLNRWKVVDPTNLYEPGFTFIAACVKSMGGEFYHLQFIHALILNSCIFYFISKNTKYWFASLLMAFLIYYIYFATEILRESIAIFIFVLNIKYFIHRKWLKFYVVVAVCIFFHLSSSFLLVLPLASRLKFNISYLFVIFGFIVLCLVIQKLFLIVAEITPLIGAKAEGYGKHTNVGYYWAGIRFIQFSLIPLLVLIFSKKVFVEPVKFQFAYLIIILLGIGILFVPIIFQRFTNYFSPLIALSFSDILCRSFKTYNPSKQLGTVIITLLMTVGYGSYYLSYGFYERWIPYSSVINPHSYPERYKFFGGG